MRFLIDESCDFIIVDSLRAEGFNTVTVSDVIQGVDDEQVIAFATQENRILITADSDFGRLIYATGVKGIGVIFLRYPVLSRREMADDLITVVRQQTTRLLDHFVTMRPNNVRIRRLPEPR